MKKVFILVMFLTSANMISIKSSVCTGDKEITSYSEYLEAFHAGPCNPVVYVPALMGTGLMVTADCDVLKSNKDSDENTAYLLKQCPFMCSWGKKYYENMIWAYQGPQWKYVYLNDFNFIWKRRDCAIFLITINYQKNSSNKYEEIKIPGLNIEIYGNSKETKTKSECGKDSVTKLFGDAYISSGIISLLESMGYITGLTFQPVPYDFRYSANKNDIVSKLKFALKMVNKFTGKRSYLIAHSYGNNTTVNGLKGLTQDEKDSLVKEYLAVGPPFLGTLQGLFFMLGQNSWLFSPSVEEHYGFKRLSKYFDAINPHYAPKLFPYLDSIYEFFPRDDQFRECYSKFQEILPDLKKFNFREGFIQDVIQDSFFVNTNNIVFKAYAKGTDFNDYTIHLVDRIVDEFGFSDFTREYYKQFDYDSLALHRNPGVATRVMFLTEISTISNLILRENPEEAFNDGRFPNLEVLYEKGDQTINIYSLTLPPLIWFSEYQKFKNSKPNGKVDLDKGTEDDPFKVSPREISFVEFGPRESKEYFPNYEYITCVDELSSNVFQKESVAETAIQKLSYYIYRTFKNGEWLFDQIKNVFVPKRNNNYNPKILPDYEEKIKENLKRKGDNPYGTKSCNHGGLVINQQFLEYFSQIIQTPDQVRTSQEKEFQPIDDKVFEQHLEECIPVTCFDGFDNCWKEFNDLFGFK